MSQESTEGEGSEASQPTNTVFVVVTTVLFTIVGWLSETGRLTRISLGDRPVRETLSPTGRRILRGYMRSALVSTVVLPVAALAIWRRETPIREVLGSYAGLLLIQMPVELVFTRLFGPNMSVIIGYVYTVFRLFQLRCLRAYLATTDSVGTRRYQVVDWIFRLGRVVWVANLAQLSYLFATRLYRSPGGEDSTDIENTNQR